MKLPYQYDFSVAAHRGDSHNYYENTMESFAAAIREGADMVETDIRLTADGQMVLMHDESALRTAGVDKTITEMTFDEVRALNVGDPDHPLQVPTLEEFLQLMAESGVMLNLEFKEYNIGDNKARCEKCIEDALALVERYGLRERTIVNSFDAYVLQYVHRHYPGQYMLHGFYPYSIMKNVDRDPTEYLYCACLGTTKKKADYDFLLSHGIEPWVGAKVTGRDHLRQCIAFGAKLVTNNDPIGTIAHLKALGER